MVAEIGMKTVAAGEFKAKCLAIMDDVQAKREPVLVTKHGKPVVKLVPVDETESADSIFGCMKDKMKIVGDPWDLVQPIIPAEDWDDGWEPRP
jgi:prevent-host-death family protein